MNAGGDLPAASTPHARTQLNERYTTTTACALSEGTAPLRAHKARHNIRVSTSGLRHENGGFQYIVRNQALADH